MMHFTKSRVVLCRLIAASALLFSSAIGLEAQQTFPTAWDPALLRRPDVRAALAHVEQGMPRQVDEWIHIAQMPGQPGFEQQRGAYVKAEMEKAGLRVRVDSMGNVTGVRAGTGGGPDGAIAGGRGAARRRRRQPAGGAR